MPTARSIAALTVMLVILGAVSCGEYNPLEPDIPTMDIFPDSVAVEVSCSQGFDAGFEGQPHVVAWYVDDIPGGDPWKGVITASGTYFAPASPPDGGQVTIRARSLEDPTLEGTATVEIRPSPSDAFVIVSPETATVKAAGSLPFTSIVSGCGSDSVIWSLDLISGVATAGLGGVVEDGVYEAPQTSGDNFEVLVRATASACINKTGIAKVRIPAQARTFTVELEAFDRSYNVPGSGSIRSEYCGRASGGESVTGLDRIGEYIDVPMNVRGGGDYIAYVRYASNPGVSIWVRIEVDGCGAAGTSAGFTLDQGEGIT
jgi:hypothetical protein